MERIPLVDLRAQHDTIRPELMHAFSSILDRSQFIKGDPVNRFENAFAEHCGAVGCVGVANGTDALALTLKAIGLEPGDEVVVPAFTFIATAEAVTMAGGRVRFADVDPGTLTLSSDTVEGCLGPRTRAIVAVHLYGHPADLSGLADLAERYGCALIGDAAQAHGASWMDRPVSNWGVASCYSFYPGKNLGALGDAGAVVSNDQDLLARVRLLADHGRQSKYEHLVEGVNSRLDALQAAFLTVKLSYLDEWTERRRTAAARYRELLKDVADLQLPTERPDARAVYHLFVVRVAEREHVLARMREHGIGVGVHYPIPLHRQPAYARSGCDTVVLPVSERAAAEVLSLPLFPEIGREQQERVAACLRAIVSP